MNTTLPLEILIEVLLSLDSIELMRVSRVCRPWKDMIEGALCLRRSCFKYPSLSYYDKGCQPTVIGGISNPNLTHIRFHPAMRCISYRMGDPISAVRICGRGAHSGYTSLTDLLVQNDFATIPTVTNLHVGILPEENDAPRKKSGLRGITFSIFNPSGITLKDIFSNMVKKFCDLVTYASGGICNQRIQIGLRFHKRAEILGRRKSYAGVKSTMIEDGIVKVMFGTVM